MQKPGRVYVTQSISFPPELLAEARCRADNLDLAFSAYVQKCIERDLAERGAIVYEERAASDGPLVAESKAKYKVSAPRRGT